VTSGTPGSAPGSAPRVRRYGDVGHLVETSSSAHALAVCAALSASGLAVTARPGLRSVLVEPAPDAPLPARAELARIVAAADPDTAAPEGATHEIGVRYDGEDLGEVAERSGLAVDEVVARHAAPLYTVACLGFSRGFPYLEGLDPALHLPRRGSPRARVPAGSVAIAADLTGIYPRATPGGWHLLGTTDVVLFDEAAEPPALLAPGDRVRFVPLAQS
jgi:KipI family sensor histidine kinase inhibitor